MDDKLLSRLNRNPEIWKRMEARQAEVAARLHAERRQQEAEAEAAGLPKPEFATLDSIELKEEDERILDKIWAEEGKQIG